MVLLPTFVMYINGYCIKVIETLRTKSVVVRTDSVVRTDLCGEDIFRW